MLFGNTSGMCRECLKSWTHELAMHNEIMFGTDSKGTRWLDKIPEDPSRN